MDTDTLNIHKRLRELVTSSESKAAFPADAFYKMIDFPVIIRCLVSEKFAWNNGKYYRKMRGTSLLTGEEERYIRQVFSLTYGYYSWHFDINTTRRRKKRKADKN